MTTSVARSPHRGLVMGAVAIVFLLCTASPALADSCSAVGTFVFTVTGGTGTLVLSTEGTAAITFGPGHGLCAVCAQPGYIFDGTYRTLATDQGCVFTIDLPKPPALMGNQIVGMVAAEGRVLLFLRATMEGFGNGLALRTDSLTGQ